MSMTELQRRLQVHVLHGAPEMHASIVATDRVSSATRLAIYSDAYRLRLIEALESNYPVIAQLLGKEFAKCGLAYINSHPSRHFSIRRFGHRFSEFLSDACSEAPWLAELARWEWATAQAFDAADATVMTERDLATIEPSDWATLRFAAHPSLTRLTLHTNIASIVKASADDDILPTPALTETTEWCIWREGLIVRYRSLDAIEAAAFDAVINGATFGELCEQLIAHIDANDVPLRAASFLKQWITEQWLCEPRS